MRKMMGQASIYLGTSAENERKVLFTGNVYNEEVDITSCVDELGTELNMRAILADHAGEQGVTLEVAAQCIEDDIIEDAWERDEYRRDLRYER